MKTVYIVDLIGKHCGMHYYINSFIKEIQRVSDVQVEILSNFNCEGKNPFLVDHYEGNTLQKGLKFLYNYLKLIWFCLTRRKSVVVFMNYGDLLEILTLPFICLTHHIIDVHEAIAQSKDSSNFHKKCFTYLYSKRVKTVIYHSDRANNMLSQLGYSGERMFVPHFRYEISRDYNANNIDDEVRSAISNDRVNLLFFGNLTKEKGIDILLSSVNILSLETKKQLNVIIAGKNIDDSVYSVKPYDDVSVNLFVRHISDDELNFFYSKCQAIAMPYRKTSQSGVLEMAFFHKLPVIATRIPYFEKTLGEFPSFGELAGSSPEEYAQALKIFVMKQTTANDGYYNAEDYGKYLHRSEVDLFLDKFVQYIK